jgi:hypothetical protein
MDRRSPRGSWTTRSEFERRGDDCFCPLSFAICRRPCIQPRSAPAIRPANQKTAQWASGLMWASLFLAARSAGCDVSFQRKGVTFAGIVPGSKSRPRA